MKSRYLRKVFLIASVVLLFVYCSKMNDLHDEYLRQGEKIYVGQPDSSKVLSGIGRVKIDYWISDPKATKLIVYWNSKDDSILTDIPATPKTNVKELFINDLPEGTYYFELVTMNSGLKNRSIPLEVTGNVYGPKFENRLLKRDLKYATYRASDSVFIQWNNATEYCIGSEILYDDRSGNIMTMFNPADSLTTILENFNGNMKYRTLFLPEDEAIDTFFTDLMPVDKIDKILDKTLFARWNPPGIPYIQYSSSYSIEKLWDNNTGTWYIQSASALPHSFTLDLGQAVDISRIKQWQRLTSGVVYNSQNVKKFELWGSASPDVSDDFSGWTILGVYESFKPSHLPVGQVSDADIAYAAAGEDFLILTDAPPLRYLRFVVRETWDAKPVIAIGDLSVFGYE